MKTKVEIEKTNDQFNKYTVVERDLYGKVLRVDSTHSLWIAVEIKKRWKEAA